MDFAHETLVAFSNTLAALHAATDAARHKAALNAEVRQLFDAAEVCIRERDSAGAAGPPATAGTHEIVVPIDGTTSALHLRRAHAFDTHEHFLAEQLRPHLAAVVGGLRPGAPEHPPAAGLEAANLRGLGLTHREAEVLVWIIQGKRDAEIARLLEAATRTVNKHVEHILEKFGVETRVAAARTGLDWLAGEGTTR